MPAAAVIPAPIVYIRVVAVKKLVVGFLSWSACAACMGVRVVRPRLSSGSLRLFIASVGVLGLLL